MLNVVFVTAYIQKFNKFAYYQLIKLSEMKKNYLIKKFCLAILFVLSLNAGAQLSGIVTINNALPTAGTNYSTFAQFVTALNTQGVNGPLTVNMTANSTFTGQYTFTQTPGVSATNTITINGNNSILTFSATAAATPWTILLNGADYITFNNLNIIGTGATYALTVHLWNGANNNQFFNCAVTSPTVGTVTTLVPFSVSGSSTTATTAGNGGSNNIVNTCTITGGYYNTVFYGPTTAPFPSGNQVINSLAREFYLYGLYNYYNVNTLFKGNIIERPTRTPLSTGYGIYLTTGSTNCRLEGNHIRRMNDADPALTAYCIYISADASAGNENIVRNNLISNLKTTTGTQAGIYLTGGSFVIAEHNTIVIDDATSASGTAYGIYCTGPSNIFRNNIVYISRGGTGTKYCLYFTAAGIPLYCDYNDLVMASTTGANGIVDLTNTYTTLASWQAFSGLDLHSSTADPVFTTPGVNYVPTSLAINNMAFPVGVTTDFNNAARSLVFPDPGAFEMYNNTPCVGLPAGNSVITPTYEVCPNTTITLQLANIGTYTNSGYSLQWHASTQSSVGIYSPIPGATLSAQGVAPNITTYYIADVICANGGTTTATYGEIKVATTVTNTVPYFEGFESRADNELPNCSWLSAGMGTVEPTYTTSATNNRVPHTGTNFAVIPATPAGTKYFYTNGIELHPNVTYSAALWYIQESGTFPNWPDFSILVGPSQNPTGLMPIASTNGTYTPFLFEALTGTFTVPSSAIYYVAIRATSGSGVAPYISWDDLSITIPCSLNSPIMSIYSSTNVVCSGRTVDLNVIGAPTVSWSSGEGTASITVSPTITTTYIATGTGTTAGCSNTIATTIMVNNTPPVVAFASDADVCAGTTITLTAAGANTYFWAHGSSAVTTVVTPTANTTYTVVGTTASCFTTALVNVTVSPNPVVQASASSTLFCAGEPVTLLGTGAGSLNYQWLTDLNTILIGNSITIMPTASGSYTLIATNSKGCEGRATVNFGVDECTGINVISGFTGLKVYPNPSSGLLNIESDNSLIKAFVLTDVTGRVIVKSELQSGKTTVDVSNLANGVYYMKLEGSAEVLKVIKSN
jgi:hypothetical protein